MSNAKELKLPWGTLSKVAEDLGISRQAVGEAWANERPDIVEAVAKEVARRVEEKKQKKQIIRQIAANLSAL